MSIKNRSKIKASLIDHGRQRFALLTSESRNGYHDVKNN